MDARSVLDELAQLHRSLRPGDSFPSHRELLQSMDASERAVRWALDELVRQGKIVRRVGRGGTYVAESGDGGTVAPVPATLASRTIVAIAKPDRSVFDHALHLLSDCTEAKELFLQCQLVAPTVRSLADLPPATVKPLGYLIFRCDLAPLARELQAAGERVALIGAPMVDTTIGVPNVYGNHALGGYRATRHLLDLGHRRIAFHGDHSLQQTQRWTGYQRALVEAEKQGLSVETCIVSLEDVARWQSDLSLARQFFERDDAPTGFISWNDHYAMMLLNLVTHIGLRVPQDISIVGYDNLPQGALMHPSLTTVDTSIEQQLETALAILTAPTPQPPSQTTIVLPTLVPRDSSAPPSV